MPAIDTEALRRWLIDNVDGVPAAAIETEVISGGASNLTLGVTIGGREFIVRRSPTGAFLPSANDMGREFRYLSALADTAVPTPRPFAFCDEAEVLGAPFYVMERLHGIVPHDGEALEGLPPTAGRALSEHFVDVLVDLHAVDIDAVGLGDAAKRTGYLERQVVRWVDQWNRARDGEESAVIDELARLLSEHRPASPPTTIVHGDYRLGNVMVDASDRSRVIGVFDWEMATLGDPLADLGYTLLYWGTTDRPPIHPSQVCADRPGFLTAAEVAARYAAASGRAVDDLTFYVVLAAFKLTIIGVGNRTRAKRQGVDPGPGGAGLALADWALEYWKR